VLEPVLVPVSDLVTGSDPLPLPDLSGTLPLEELPASGPVAAARTNFVEPVQDAAVAVRAGSFGAAEPARAADVNAAAPSLTVFPGFGAAFLAETAGIQPAVHPSGGGDAGQPVTDDPAQSPAVPGTGTGSGGPASVAFGSAAWLSAYDFDHFLCRAVLAREDGEHAPAPVSFDPGSSPD